MLDAVRTQADRRLHRRRVGGVRHHLELAQLADVERRLQLVVEQERMPVQVPCRAHDAARQVELDVIDAVLDLLADRLDPAVGPVDLQRVTRGEEVPAGGREEMARCEETRAEVLARLERALPRHIHVVVRAGAAEADDARLEQAGLQAMPEQRHLVGQRHLGQREVVGMDVHVPQARQQVRTLEVDRLGVADRSCGAAAEDLLDAAVLEQHRAVGLGDRLNAVDQRRVGQKRSHRQGS